MPHKTPDCILPLTRAGISDVDAYALRRIAMTLHKWHELECGHGDDRASWTIARGRKSNGSFEYDDNGAPFIEYHSHSENKPRYTATPDRERGALKHLTKIMTRYPTLGYYIQGDPRGAPLYILRPGDVRSGAEVDANYSNGLAVYQ